MIRHLVFAVATWYSLVLAMGGINTIASRLWRTRRLGSPFFCHCDGCGERLRALDCYLPVASYFLLRGRARCCGYRLSPAHPATELVGGTLLYLVLVVLPAGAA
jgi:leader peptidase (prepilin peptidase)/N-methyltransferase